MPHAMAAMDAVFNFFHFFLPFLRQPGGRRGAAQHQGHSGGVVDFDSGRTGHTIAAAPAKIAGKLLSVLGDLILPLLGKHRLVFLVGKEFIQLLLPLDPPNRQYAVKLVQIGVSGGGIRNQPAGEGLHGDKAQVSFLAQPDDLQLLLSGQIAEGKLYRIVQARLDGLNRHMIPVVGQPDKPDFPLAPGFLHRLVQAGAIPRLWAEGRVVKLKDIHIVCFHQPQAGFQILPKALRRRGRGFCGDGDPAAHVAEGIADFFLAVGIASGSVKKIDPVVIGLPQDRPRLVEADPLHRQRAKAVFVGGDPCSSQSNLGHTKHLPFLFFRIAFESYRMPDAVSGGYFQWFRPWLILIVYIIKFYTRFNCFSMLENQKTVNRIFLLSP